MRRLPDDAVLMGSAGRSASAPAQCGTQDTTTVGPVYIPRIVANRRAMDVGAKHLRGYYGARRRIATRGRRNEREKGVGERWNKSCRTCTE